MSTEYRSFQIESIHTAPSMGAPMEARNRVKVTQGRGLDGDRYKVVETIERGSVVNGSNGYYSGSRIPDSDRAVTAYSLDARDEANERLIALGLEPFAPGETRRQIGVRGISNDQLTDLIGARVFFGNIPFVVTEACPPCTRLQQLRRGVPPTERNVPATDEDKAVKGAYMKLAGVRLTPEASGLVNVYDRLTIPQLNTGRRGK